MKTLGELAGVTIVTPDLERSVVAYAEALGYRPVDEETTVGPARAAAWGFPDTATCRIRHLYPESGEPRFLRFIESDTPTGYRPMSTYGWNAVELVVQDLDALHGHLLSQSAFEVIGPPKVLEFDFTDQISAMQVRGPSGEVLYLTEINAEIPGFELATAQSFVGRPFVAILGVPSIDVAGAWYAAHMGRPAMPPFQVRIDVLSEAHGLPVEHRHRLTTAVLPGGSLIEIDDFPPATTTQRPLSSCGLPMAIAMASFFVDPARAGGSTVDRGVVGELIETLATPQ